MDNCILLQKRNKTVIPAQFELERNELITAFRTPVVYFLKDK